MKVASYISRVPDHNGISPLYIMLEIHHSGQEPLICTVVEAKIVICLVDNSPLLGFFATGP